MKKGGLEGLKNVFLQMIRADPVLKIKNNFG